MIYSYFQVPEVGEFFRKFKGGGQIMNLKKKRLIHNAVPVVLNDLMKENLPPEHQPNPLHVNWPITCLTARPFTQSH